MIEFTGKIQFLDSDGIREALAPFRVDLVNPWIYPKQGANGCVGKLCVSEAKMVDVTGATQKLAVHLTFNVTKFVVPKLAKAENAGSSGAVQDDELVQVYMKNLHFTARPAKQQKLIDTCATSCKEFSKAGTHRGMDNTWRHDRNQAKLREIADELGITDYDAAKIAINNALTDYTADYLQKLGQLIVTNFTVEPPKQVKPSSLTYFAKMKIVANWDKEDD